MTIEFTADMRQLVGGDEESHCRRMVLAGVAWLAENPEAELEFAGTRSVSGSIMVNDSPSAQSLLDCLWAAHPTAPDRVLRVAVAHVLQVQHYGWPLYVKIMNGTATKEIRKCGIANGRVIHGDWVAESQQSRLKQEIKESAKTSNKRFYIEERYVDKTEAS